MYIMPLLLVQFDKSPTYNVLYSVLLTYFVVADHQNLFSLIYEIETGRVDLLCLRKRNNFNVFQVNY